ncbi:MAG: glycine cleavage T C-terminal barrel domain-containing protein [Bacteroidota bacterium]
MKIFNPDPEQYLAAFAGTVFVRLSRGVIRGGGADRLDLLHRLSTNATRELAPGDETTTILTSDKGRIVEVLRVVAADDHILMITSGSDTEPVRTWLDKYTIMDDFATADATPDHAVLGLYGDHAKSLLADALGMEIANAGKVARGTIDGGEILVLRDVRLTGAGAFLVIAAADALGGVVERLAGAGAGEIDQATYETLRIEAGVPEIGRELTESYNPLEAGLTQYISFTKGCYIGQEVIARLDTYDKVQRHMVGLTFADGVAGFDGDEIELADAEEGKKIGAVTSMAYSPRLDRTIGLAYVRTVYSVPGGMVRAGNGDAAVITRLPFD